MTLKKRFQFSFSILIGLTGFAAFGAYANATSIRALISNWTAETIGSQRDEPGVWNSYAEMHAHYTQEFVESDGFGATRMSAFDAAELKVLTVRGDTFV